MFLFWLCFFIVFVLVGLFVLHLKTEALNMESDYMDALSTKISKIPNKGNLTKIIGEINRYAFILDKEGKKVYYINSYQTTEIQFNQIISVEVKEDNRLLSSKSTSRTVAGALIGGALAGSAGMIVGGLSGDTKQEKKVSKISVKIKLRDFSTPSIMIECFNASELTKNAYAEIDPSDSIYGNYYNQELQNAQKIADYISVIIDEVDRQERLHSQTPQTKLKECSVADELTKLAKLKADGILTEEEFQAQKTKLLS